MGRTQSALFAALLAGLMAVLGGLLRAGPEAVAQVSGIRLVMVEAPGCSHCQRWLSDVGAEYSLTAEGRFAPLQRVMIGDVRARFPWVGRVIFTPTFIVVNQNQEVARLEGYISEEFFWPMIGAELEKLGFRPSQP